MNRAARRAMQAQARHDGDSARVLAATFTEIGRMVSSASEIPVSADDAARGAFGLYCAGCLELVSDRRRRIIRYRTVVPPMRLPRDDHGLLATVAHLLGARPGQPS